MNPRRLTEKLDDVLKPLGFERHKITWNRNLGIVVQVMDIQVSKSNKAVTVNAGVLDADVFTKLWEGDPPRFVEEPACTVRARIGELMDGKDVWWQLYDDQVIHAVSSATTDRILPFLDRMRSRRGMIQWLMDTDVVMKRYPLPIINLAILQSLTGNSGEACTLLAAVQKNAVGAWRVRAAEIAQRIDCANLG